MERQPYRVSDDVAWVNGRPVGEDRTVRLTPIEARFDLQHGRIAQVPEPPAPPAVQRPAPRKRARG